MLSLGISLSPSVLLPKPQDEVSRKLMRIFGSPEALLSFLREQGLSSVELRTVGPGMAPEDVSACAGLIWDAGLRVTVHGMLPEGGGRGLFQEDYPSLLPLLKELRARGETVTVTVHAYSRGTERDYPALAAGTTEVLKGWSADAERLGFRLSLENNQTHGFLHPGITCESVSGMIRDLPPESVGTTFDMGHFHSNTLKGAEKDSLPPEEFLSRCFQTHIHAFSGRTHMPLLPGNPLPLRQYAEALFRHGYSHVLNLELEFGRFPSLDWRECIAVSAEALRSL